MKYLKNLKIEINRLNDKKLLTYLTGTIAIIFICGLLFGSMLGIYYGKNTYSEEQTRHLKSLTIKVDNLNSEIGRLKLINQNLKKAIFLADSTLFQDEKSLKKDEKKNIKASVISSIESFFSIVYNYFGRPKFVKPVTGEISRGFDIKNSHLGIDFAVKIGSPIFASNSGYVIFADFTVNYGYVIIIQHNNGYITFYKHCSSLLKKERETIYEGELIALSGNSGKLTTGPHLHFEIWYNGEAVDPQIYL